MNRHTMLSPHVIRLRGPWNYRVLAIDHQLADGTVNRENAPAGLVGATTVGKDWSDVLGQGFRGCVRYSRHFNCSSGISPSTRVALVIEAVDALGHVIFNATPLGQMVWPHMPKKYDLSGRLLPRNELQIDVDLPRTCLEDAAGISRPASRQNADAGGVVGEVRLEIG